MTIGSRSRRPRLLYGRLDTVGRRRILDLIAVSPAIPLFARIGDPEIPLQTLWLAVALGAFLYGLAPAIARIGIATLVTVGYLWTSVAFGVPPNEEHFELTEWPLMVSIAIIVAFLADRVSSSARRYASLYRQASERLVTAHEEERARLARDLHDGVGQTLTAVVLHLDAAETAIRLAHDGDESSELDPIHRARELATAALAETRHVATELRPTRVHEIGLGAALRNLAGSAGVPVELKFDANLLPPGLLDPDLEIDVYRIVQESLGNAARHSGARRVWIGAHVLDTTLRLVVVDDGVGFEAGDREHGLGIEGMLDRAAIHGGAVEVSSRRGEGTRVEIAVPLTPAPDVTGALPVPAADAVR